MRVCTYPRFEGHHHLWGSPPPMLGQGVKEQGRVRGQWGSKDSEGML